MRDANPTVINLSIRRADLVRERAKSSRDMLTRVEELESDLVRLIDYIDHVDETVETQRRVIQRLVRILRDVETRLGVRGDSDVDDQ